MSRKIADCDKKIWKKEERKNEFIQNLVLKDEEIEQLRHKNHMKQMDDDLEDNFDSDFNCNWNLNFDCNF